MARKEDGIDFGKQLIKIFRERNLLAKENNDSSDIGMTDVLIELNKNHYKQTQSVSEEKCLQNLSFQNIRPKFPYNFWAPDILPWMKNKQVSLISY